MPNLCNDLDCTGCTACKNICPVEAIKMVANNEGFKYPKIDIEKCIECKQCEKVCPIINEYRSDLNGNEYEAYVVQNNDIVERKQSTSGGAFTLIAKYILEKNGIVFGAMFDDELNVVHNYITNENEIYKFRNSKYVQSELDKTFKIIKEFLDNGKLVLFSGTPCQVSGLKSFLRNDYSNLITCDFICHAVPSPLVYKRYIEKMKKRYDFNKVVFRDKKYGYSCSTFALYNGNKCVYRGLSEKDQYMRLFLNDYCSRKSCYTCKSQPYIHNSDFTLWDCWNPSKAYNKHFDNMGTTNMIAWSDKAISILSERTFDFIYKVNIEDIYSGERDNKLKNKVDRNEFFKIVNDDKIDFFDYFVPITMKIRFKSFIRLFLIKIHLHNFVRKIAHKFRR